MKNRAIEDLRSLCASYNVQAQEFARGHFRLSNHGVSLDYWPASKTRTVFMSGKRLENISPFDAIMLLKKNAKVGIDKNRVIRKFPPKNIKPIITHGICKHFAECEIPWEGDPWMAESDKVRMEAYQLENKVIELRALADDMDDPDSDVYAAIELDRQQLAGISL